MVRYDAVIVGAGIGGLSAAALLAKAGKHILLLEADQVVGGRTRSKTLEGFRIPLGASCIQLEGVIPDICQAVGAKMDVVDISKTYFWIDGQIHELPAKGNLAKMLELFVQAGGKDHGKVMGRLAVEMAVSKVKQAFRTDARRDKFDDSLSFREWLSGHTDNQKLLDLFHSITSSMSGVNDFEYPVKHWFAWASSKAMSGRFEKYGMAPGGFETISRSLAEATIRLGGQIETGATVRHISVGNGKATGVVYEHSGETRAVDANWVISNVGPRKTMELAGPEVFTATYRERLENRVRGAPIVVTAAVSPVPLTDVSGMVIAAGLNRVVSFGCLTYAAPDLAPDGWHLVTFYGTPGSCLRPMDKEEEIRLNVEDVRTIFPDLERNGGRILDVHCRNPDDPYALYRSWPGYDMPTETSVPNLFNVGDGVKPMGYIGTPAAALSAKQVVEKIV